MREKSVHARQPYFSPSCPSNFTLQQTTSPWNLGTRHSLKGVVTIFSSCIFKRDCLHIPLFYQPVRTPQILASSCNPEFDSTVGAFFRENTCPQHCPGDPAIAGIYTSSQQLQSGKSLYMPNVKNNVFLPSLTRESGPESTSSVQVSWEH